MYEKREKERENTLLYVAVGSPATSPYPKSSYKCRIRPKIITVIGKELSKTLTLSHMATSKHPQE